MSFYKSIDKELAKLEDPKVLSIKLQKDHVRSTASFRSTVYNVASRRGIPIKVEMLGECIYEISRKLSDSVSVFTGSIDNGKGPMIQKNLKVSTNIFNERTLAASIVLMSEGVASHFEFISYSKKELDDLRPQVKEMGMKEMLDALMVEEDENSLHIRVENEFDRLAKSATTT